MTAKMTKLAWMTVGVASVSLLACGPKNKEGEPQPIDKTTARQALVSNTQIMAGDLSRNLQFVERSRLLREGIDNVYGSDTLVECVPAPDGGEDCNSVPDPEPASEDIDLDITDETDELVNELETRLIPDAAVESESEFEVTYLVRGDLICQVEGEPLDQECVEMWDDAEIRIVLSSPSPGDIDVDLLIGPNRSNPVSLFFHQDLLAAEVDLAGIKQSADHIAMLTGGEVELPSTFDGRVRLELSAPSDHQIGAQVSVLRALKVADGEYAFSLGVSDPLWSVMLDSNAETITGESNVGPVAGLLPITRYIYDDVTGAETEESYDLSFNVAGVTGKSVLDVANEILSLTNMGLGSDAATVSIDGEQVVGVDLNPNDGRSLNATVSVDAEDNVVVELDPKLDLRVALDFANAVAALGDVDEWMLDEVFSVRFDGAAKPSMSFDGDALQVTDGTLTLALENAGITHTISAGQCLIESTEAPVANNTTEPDPVEPVDESWTPLDDLEAGSCQ